MKFLFECQAEFPKGLESINLVDALQSIMAIMLDVVVVGEVPILTGITIGS